MMLRALVRQNQTEEARNSVRRDRAVCAGLPDWRSGEKGPRKTKKADPEPGTDHSGTAQRAATQKYDTEQGPEKFHVCPIFLKVSAISSRSAITRPMVARISRTISACSGARSCPSQNALRIRRATRSVA